MERRHLFKRTFGAALVVLAFYYEEVFEYLFPRKPEPIHTGSEHFHGTPTIIVMEPADMRWTGGVMLVNGEEV